MSSREGSDPPREWVNVYTGITAKQAAEGMRAMQRLYARWNRAIDAALAEDERRAKAAIIDRLPRTGPWLCEHPRTLRWLFKIRPSLRPEIAVYWPHTLSSASIARTTTPTPPKSQ